MDSQQLYEVYVKEALNQIDNKNFEKALDILGEMKKRMYAEEPVDPVMLGWQKYYTFACLSDLERDSETVNEFIGEEPHYFIFNHQQVSFMASVCAEICCRRNDPVLCNKFCRLAWTSACYDEDFEVRLEKARIACVYFALMKQAKLNFSFARFIAGCGKVNKVPALHMQGLEFLLGNYRESHNLTIGAMLRMSMDEVKTYANLGDDSIEQQRVDDFLKEVEEIPEEIKISGKFEEAKDLLLNKKYDELRTIIDENPSLLVEYDSTGNTLLITAAEVNDLDACLLLCEKGVDIHKTEFISFHTALQVAAKKGHYEMVKFLIDEGADPEVKDKFGFTPLHLTIIEHQLDALATLLGYGVFLERLDGNNDTPLQAAIRADNFDAVKMLISAGADITVKTKDNQTIFQLAEGLKNPTIAKFIAPLKSN